MTADDFRRIALEMHAAVEGAHMGHPDFRVNGRIFASIHSKDTRGMVKLTPEEQKAVLAEAPDMFEPSAGAWGRQGCTNVILSAADRRTVRAAMLLAFEGALAMPRRRPPAQAAGRKRAASGRRKS